MPVIRLDGLAAQPGCIARVFEFSLKFQFVHRLYLIVLQYPQLLQVMLY